MSEPSARPQNTVPVPEEHTWSPEKFRRKIDQEWEMAGCARHDRDTDDEKRHTDEARRLTALYKQLYS